MPLDSENGVPSTEDHQMALTTKNPSDGSSQISSPPCNTTETKPSKESRFMNLPIELRLRIYEFLLISRYDSTESRGWAVGTTCQKMITLGTLHAYSGVRAISTAILRTSKQIHQEANPVLYSLNVFAINHPDSLTQFMAQIGVPNLNLVKSIYILLNNDDDTPGWWIRLLQSLSIKATGLRRLSLVLALWVEDGVGENLDFVHALGKIQGLDEMVLEGYYLETWPAYLEQNMPGTKTKALQGLHYDGSLWDEELCAEGNEQERERFVRFQEGKEDLISWPLNM